MSNRKVLLLILAFVAFSLGSFIWMVATWDARHAQRDAALNPLPNIYTLEIPAHYERATL